MKQLHVPHLELGKKITKGTEIQYYHATIQGFFFNFKRERSKVFLEEKGGNYGMGLLDGLMGRNLSKKTRNKTPYFTSKLY